MCPDDDALEIFVRSDARLELHSRFTAPQRLQSPLFPNFSLDLNAAFESWESI